ncbi:MBL fold metallo-hydrolase RNA specificity domain-containing protein [Haliea sp. E17]|uniref:MBL fold metallo-hydrolase RNA specificity domain-containing protein n=1 Tax=Haliea sp. E17 TaxID=3401576 RepID=UPI003AAF4320
MAKLTFLGAAREVTGSCHLLQSPATGRVLLDCGMHQGGDAVKRLRQEEFEFDPARIDTVLLSHAHLDHSGLLPRLYREGFRGEILCTAATYELLEILLKDAVGLYLRDLERENLRNARRGREQSEPLYGQQDVDGVLGLCRPEPYGKHVSMGTAATVIFHDAGHILGSSIVEVRLNEEGAAKTLVFSGDLGKQDSVLMNPPCRLQHADVLLVESTYGDREHRSEDNSIEQLREILHETWSAGGNVMIPAFAVGRTQDILFHLGCLLHRGELDNWQIFLDSPMAIAVTKVYDRWIKLDHCEEVRELSEHHRQSLEQFLPTLQLTREVEESMAINRVKKGAIIIAGSGMCTGGRIRHHFKHRIWDSRNTILFAGYQARGTLGRLIVDGAKHIRMFGDEYIVKARVETLGGLSAHAGQSTLVNWIGEFQPPPRVYLVHGEPEAQDVLAQRLLQEQNLQVETPDQGHQTHF